MIVLIAAAMASGVGAGTAETLPQGEVVIRLPTGRSAWGVTQHDELSLTPWDVGVGGPRLGWEHSERLGSLICSVRSSVAIKDTLRRGSFRVEPAVSMPVGDHLLSVEFAVDLRWTHRFSVADSSSHRLGVDRIQSQALVVWDAPKWRAKVRLPLRDRGHTMRWGSGSLAYTHRGEHLYVGAGVGMLVGKPVDIHTLGTYEWFFWQPFPQVDLALRF